MLEFGLITNDVNAVSLTDSTLIECTKGIQVAMKATDKAAGMQAYFMEKARIRFAGLDSNDTIDGFKKLHDYALKVFGIKKAQCYNLAKAGSFIKQVDVCDSNGDAHTEYIDCFTYARIVKKDVNGNDAPIFDYDFDHVKPFSNTALIAIAYRIGSEKKEDDRKRVETAILKAIEIGYITSELSVKKLEAAMEKLLKPIPAPTETAPTETAPTEKAPTETAPTETASTKLNSFDDLTQEEFDQRYKNAEQKFNEYSEIVDFCVTHGLVSSLDEFEQKYNKVYYAFRIAYDTYTALREYADSKETAPTETAPTETAPTETAPTETAPTETAPTETAPTKTKRGKRQSN